MKLEQWLGTENQLGMDIWKKKYQQNNETFDEWLDRVSGGNEKIRQLIVEKKFLFGGRILSNRGLAKEDRKLTYSNCYVIQPPEDNIESIFECAAKLARTFSYGGGCGIDISKLSPRGAKINNSAKETTGSVSFMELYNLVTGLIGQNGRRGALMLSIDCNHPDLEEFIDNFRQVVKNTSAIERCAAAHRGKRFYTDGTTNVLADECPEGFHLGLTTEHHYEFRSMSDETKEKLRQANLGKKRDTSQFVQLNEKKERCMDERAKKISNALKGIKRKPMSDETKLLIAKAARIQKENELNKIHQLGYKTKAELFEHFNCKGYNYKKAVPAEVLETMVKFGKWNCYKF